LWNCIVCTSSKYDVLIATLFLFCFQQSLNLLLQWLPSFSLVPPTTFNIILCYYGNLSCDTFKNTMQSLKGRITHCWNLYSSTKCPQWHAENLMTGQWLKSCSSCFQTWTKMRKSWYKVWWHFKETRTCHLMVEWREYHSGKWDLHYPSPMCSWMLVRVFFFFPLESLLKSQQDRLSWLGFILRN
jgi:hypothetical protein